MLINTSEDIAEVLGQLGHNTFRQTLRNVRLKKRTKDNSKFRKHDLQRKILIGFI